RRTGLRRAAEVFFLVGIGRTPVELRLLCNTDLAVAATSTSARPVCARSNDSMAERLTTGIVPNRKRTHSLEDASGFRHQISPTRAPLFLRKGSLATPGVRIPPAPPPSPYLSVF